MQTHRILSLGSILAMLVIPVIGWFLVAQPQLAAATAADQQRAEIQSQIAASAAVVAQLKEDSHNLPALNEDLNDLRGSIPADIDPSGYLDGLGALAAASGVDIGGLTVGEPAAYAPATPDAGPVTPDPTATDDPAGADAASSTPPPVADPAIVTSPLITGDNFVAIPVTLDVAGPYDAILSFVRGVQTGDRLFLVSSLSIARDSSSDAMTASIGGFIYAIPTGLEGHPRPVSTVVKQMDAVTTDGTDATDGTTTDGTDAPDPGATDTPDAP